MERKGVNAMAEERTTDYTDLRSLSDDEVVTHSYPRDVRLPSGRTIVLITLDNGRDHHRPNTLGPATLLELRDVLDTVKERAARGEIDAVAVTGKPYFLAAGADLSKVSEIPDRRIAGLLPRLGHEVLGSLSRLGVPSFVFINGLALGGGLEIGLNADYRTVDLTARGIGLPEVFLGLVPGWGGAMLLPNLIGIENALKVMIENPLKSNRTLDGRAALKLGIADAGFGSARFLEESLAWADGVLGGSVQVERPNTPGRLERMVKWDAAVGIARKQVASRIGTVAEAPFRALELLKAAKSGDRDAGFAREDEALADLICSDQFHASIYAFNLVQKRSKHPAGAPDAGLARPVTKVGVIGAGLMARQFALLFLRRLRVPVLITDVDAERVAAGVAAVRDGVEELRAKGRIGDDEAARLTAAVGGTVETADFADCDWVIEAVFEDLQTKQDVFAELEPHLSETAVLATNTSSLSVAEIGARLRHPERLVGFHFFNPVSVMPLIEVVRQQSTDEATLATAMATARALKKNAVITADTPGFVVNRILARLLGEAMHAIDTGTPVSDVDEALSPMGLPMSPSALLDLVGLRVAAHVLDTHHAAFPDRFHESRNLHRLAEHGHLHVIGKDGSPTATLDRSALAVLEVGDSPVPGAELLTRVQDALADEASRMLAEKVVPAPEDIDLCLILGAGWPFQMGGVTPYLDRVGASERVTGGTFHTPPIAGIH